MPLVDVLSTLRDVVLMIAVPLLVVRGRSGFFLFFYLCAVWLFCLNPLLARMWMANILAPTYFRLVYLLAASSALRVDSGCRAPASAARHGSLTSRSTNCGGAVGDHCRVSSTATADFQSCREMPSSVSVGSRRGNTSCFPRILILPKLPVRYIAHAKLLAPIWTAGCELPLLFPEMKVVAPRLVYALFRQRRQPRRRQPSQPGGGFYCRKATRQS